MFELHGIFDLSPRRSALPPIPILPALAWSGVANREHRVAGQGLVAHYAEHPIGVPSYAAAGGLHTFVVGEPRLRSDAPATATGAAPIPGLPLTAPQILALRQRAPGCFLHWLKGDFTLILVDETARRVMIHNGRFGIMPFYYVRDGERVLFSTSLAAIGTTLSRRPERDAAATIEVRLFNYPLGRRTFLREVSALRPAETVEIDAAGLRRRFHWDVRSLLDRPHMPADEALDAGASLFRRTVNDLAADQRRACLSFTAGFDSRTVLGVLDHDRDDLLGYAFGVANSPNVTIPRRLASRIGLPFLPIILEDDYARDFDDYARRAIFLSDGLSTLERANYPYAFEQLGTFSPVVLSGLFGSELLRTFQNVGEMVSASMMRLNAARDPLAELDAVLAQAGDGDASARDAVRADVREVVTERFAGLPPDRRFYMLLLTEILRKYFGAELAMERPYAVNRAPFLDDEFVEFLFCAPFAGVRSRVLRPTVGNRYRSQYFYAHILRTYRPELLGATTDHGYPPGDLLSPLAPLLVGPKVLYRRWRRQQDGPEFRTNEWTEGFYRRWFAARPPGENGQPSALSRAFADGSWRSRRREYAREVSLALWHEAVAP